ncbi:hypothetical protein COT20_02000 [bacterium (Candidatus Gribaldobacteria) CG08_land_8_20_14_0_20_39_15]|uniref:DUF4325 domain-containing protein n=1 Tax=bacterium (Candidatus Gribaldobacteria) CG08_land_8_20_14_0_20_39_15 TaxID=2014273 RepID=A0A2M6XUA3_9BACT|nr:MAG: hypothetical protein COT20_02000 [bacterium (Candidatus Gribaldobacteria) CG08_land_8_20_14_0_20_39_15]
MIIELKKFGTTLISRQTGREAFSALQPFLKDVKEKETVEVNFGGVLTFSPSWGDEFLTPLLNIYGERLILRNTSNLSVQATLDILEKTMKTKQRKIYWCQCSRNISKHIKRGSSSVDTKKVCPECGGRIFEEDAKNHFNLYLKRNPKRSE